LWSYSFILLNIYFPNGGTRADGTPMLPYKLDFYNSFLNYINDLRSQWENILVTWDYNVAHTEIDIARPKENEKNIWFLPEERAKLDELCEAGYVDLWRYFHSEVVDKYTRWSYRSWARPRNVWRRLDYFFASTGLIEKVVSVSHLDQIFGSDHCPVELILKDE
jgi:exodeoxyribonuclease-3